jgi:hypothetical protein
MHVITPICTTPITTAAAISGNPELEIGPAPEQGAARVLRSRSTAQDRDATPCSRAVSRR